MEDEPSVDINPDDVFIATDEWAEIRPGQVVPSGLHYRFVLLGKV